MTICEVFDNSLNSTPGENLTERREGELVDDALMLDLIRRAVLPSPVVQDWMKEDQIGYPATIVHYTQDGSQMILGTSIIRTKTRRQARRVTEWGDHECLQASA